MRIECARAGFTLMELLIVILIIGILGALGSQGFGKTMEKKLDKEVISNLKIIHGAEITYFMDHDKYYPQVAASVSNLTSINSNLGLIIPTTDKWRYTVYQTGCVGALRLGNDNRNWSQTIAQDEPVQANQCP